MNRLPRAASRIAAAAAAAETDETDETEEDAMSEDSSANGLGQGLEDLLEFIRDSRGFDFTGYMGGPGSPPSESPSYATHAGPKPNTKLQ